MRHLLLGALFASFLGGQASATVLFTSFVGSDVGGDTTTSSLEGLQFTATGTGQLAQVIFEGFALNASTPVVWPLTLYEDSGGLPSNPLETWDPTVSATPTPITLYSVVHPTITAGDVYWLILQNATPASVADMGWEVFNGTSLGYFVGSFDTLNTMGNAFPGTPGAGVELDTMTPEPASSALIGAGCLLLLAMVRMRKAHRRAVA